MILVDANSIGYASTAANNLSAGTVQTGGVFGFLNTLRAIRLEYNGRMVCLWDSRSWRYDEFPDYKQNRKADPQLVALTASWKPQRKLVAQALACIGVSQMMAANMEADDLAGRIVAKSTKDIVLITGDKDWLQLVSPTVRWVDPIARKMAGGKVLHRKASIEDFASSPAKAATPWQFIQLKALEGDAGDNIPGIGGCGPMAAKQIFDEFGSVDGFLNEAQLDGARFKNLPKKLRDFADSEEKISAYRRNLRLVWLNHPGLPAAIQPRHVKPAYNRDAFEQLCGELAFHSILRDLDAWARPFLQLDEEIT